MSKVFKKTSLLQRAFGVNGEGHNGARVFLGELTSASAKKFNISWFFMSAATSTIGGAMIYGLSQWAEHDLVNVRPDLPETVYMQTDSADNISAVTIYNDHDYQPTSWGNINGEKSYLLIETDGTYEISSCSRTICTPLTADDVLELRGEMRVMAQEEEIEYLSPDFFFPSKIESLTSLMQIQDITGAFDDESFISGTSRRELVAESYKVDGDLQRLNSENMSFNVAHTTSLWRTALDSPDNGTYQIRNGEQDLFTWQRTQNGEWQDLPTSEFMPFTMLGVWLLLNSGLAAGQIGTARRQTLQKVDKLKGLDLLKR